MEQTLKGLPSVLLLSVFLMGSAEAAKSRAVQVQDDSIPELHCVIEPSEIVDVGTAVPGVVESIYAYRSDRVKKGQIIVALESSVERASLELAKENAAMNTAIELRKASAAFGHRTQKRNLGLLQTSAISLQEMDQVETDTRLAELQVKQEKDNKRIQQLEYLRTKAVLQQRNIRSPIEGVVMERFKSVGEYVKDEPVFRVAQLDPLHVEVIVPVDYLGRIVPGMQAKVTPGIAGSGTYLADVQRVDSIADAASGTFGVRLRLSNPDYEIVAGMRCQLEFLPPKEKASDELAGETGMLPASEQGSRERMTEPLESAQQPESTPSDVAISATILSDVALSNMASKAAMVDASEQQGACYTLGPVEEEALLQQLSVRLKDQSDKLILRNENVSVDKDYLVLAAPASDRQETIRLVSRLSKAGITDRFVLTRGDNKGRISLGVYNQSSSALKRKRMLVAKGFAVDIVPRGKVTKQYWLDVSFKAGVDLSGQHQEIAPFLTPSSSFKPVACSQRLAQR